MTLLVVSIAKICRVSKYTYDVGLKDGENWHHYQETVEKTRDGQMFPPFKCGRGIRL